MHCRPASPVSPPLIAERHAGSLSLAQCRSMCLDVAQTRADPISALVASGSLSVLRIFRVAWRRRGWPAAPHVVRRRAAAHSVAEIVAAPAQTRRARLSAAPALLRDTSRRGASRSQVEANADADAGDAAGAIVGDEVLMPAPALTPTPCHIDVWSIVGRWALWSGEAKQVGVL